MSYARSNDRARSELGRQRYDVFHLVLTLEAIQAEHAKNFTIL